MTKFKVGDKVRFIEKFGEYNKGDEVTIKSFIDTDHVKFEGEHGAGDAYTRRLELVKTTKNQRIAALENEVAELKLIVQELRNQPKVENIINTVEGVKHPEVRIEQTSNFMTAKEGMELGKCITKGLVDGLNGVLEFEGRKYRKVDREACDGDVVVFDKSVKFQGTEIVTKGKLYKAKKGILGELAFVDNEGYSANVYDGSITKFTTENVAVYELIKPKTLTPNQQRAAVIEKAKKFVEENVANGRVGASERHADKGNITYRDNYYDVDFFVKERKVTAVVYWLAYNKERIAKPANVGRAKCDPSDVFNEHIGKAIALGRALGLDVSEFEQAVQPNDVAVGQEVEFYNSMGSILDTFVVKRIEKVSYETRTFKSETRPNYYRFEPDGTGDKIINDTNAIYA